MKANAAVRIGCSRDGSLDDGFRPHVFGLIYIANQADARIARMPPLAG